MKSQADMASKVETQTKGDNVEGLESGVAQGGAGAEEAAIVEANTELKANTGTKADEEHENQDTDDDVLQFEGGEDKDSGDPNKFDAAEVARAAEAEAKAAEEEAKAAATEAMMAREDASAEVEAEVPTSSEC